MSDNNGLLATASPQPALVASLPEPVPVSAHSGDGQAHSSAILSECGRYRYRLERQCEGTGQTVIIMVNPSTADAATDDATIRKLKGFGDRNRWGRLVVGNLFAYRATNVKVLASVENPVGPLNDEHLLDILAGANQIVFAWGPTSKLPKRLRARWRTIWTMVNEEFGQRAYSIGKPAKDGHPCHPLMLPYDLELRPWKPAL